MLVLSDKGGWGGERVVSSKQKMVRPKRKVSRYSLYIIIYSYIKFQVPNSSSSLVLKQTVGETDGRRDRQAQTNMPPSTSLKFRA